MHNRSTQRKMFLYNALNTTLDIFKGRIFHVVFVTIDFGIENQMK